MRSSSFVTLSLAACAALAGTLFACSSADGEGSSESEANAAACTLTLTNKADKGPFCPFQAGGKADYCAVGEDCVSPGKVGDKYADSFCAKTGSGYPAPNAANGGFAWQCDSDDQCGDGNVCCGDFEVGADKTCTSNMYGSKNKGSTCRKSCTGTALVLCTEDADCNTGGNNTPADAGAADAGNNPGDGGNAPGDAGTDEPVDGGAADASTGEDAGAPADEAAAAKVPCTPVSFSGKKVLGYCGAPKAPKPTTDAGSGSGGGKKDAGASSGSGSTDDDADDEGDDDTTTADAGKRSSNITPRPLALNQGGCSTSQGPAPVGSLAGLGLGLAVLAMRRRKQH